jgi:hypothetical protein
MLDVEKPHSFNKSREMQRKQATSILCIAALATSGPL